MYLYILSRELALTCFSVTVLLWLVALRYGAFTRKAQRAYQDGLAETNEVCFNAFLQLTCLCMGVVGQNSVLVVQIPSICSMLHQP